MISTGMTRDSEPLSEAEAAKRPGGRAAARQLEECAASAEANYGRKLAAFISPTHTEADA